jgi:hypothetical protein
MVSVVGAGCGVAARWFPTVPTIMAGCVGVETGSLLVNGASSLSWLVGVRGSVGSLAVDSSSSAMGGSQVLRRNCKSFASGVTKGGRDMVLQGTGTRPSAASWVGGRWRETGRRRGGGRERRDDVKEPSDGAGCGRGRDEPEGG